MLKQNQIRCGTERDAIPPMAAMINSCSTIAIQRSNVETLALLKESIKGWSDQVRAVRCSNGGLAAVWPSKR